MQAANDLDAFIVRRPADCSPLSLDPYDRTVATRSFDGTDLGEWLVRKGLALDCPNTRTADIVALSAKPNVPAGESGRVAMSSRGLYRACIRANGKPPPVRMTPTRIPKASAHAAFILNFTGGVEI
jgi:hypothetical protein